MTQLTISKHFTFEASHILPKHPGKCSRLHGHSWGLEIGVRGPLNSETGFVLDYAALKDTVTNHIINILDHQHLGQGFAYCADVAQPPPFGTSFYPSSENLARAIGKILQPLIPELAPNAKLAFVTLEETCTSRCTWRPEDEQ